MIKPIPNLKTYYADEDGSIYSFKKNKFKKLKPFFDGQHKYLQVTCSICNKTKKYLVHRLIALTFVDNPNNYNIVDHIDNDTTNNAASNLQWCTQAFNVQKSYATMSPIRNYREVILFKNNIPLREFQSITEACNYAVRYFNCSTSSLSKYRKSKDLKLEYKNSDMV